MNVKTKDLTQYFDFKILVKQIEGITDTGLEKSSLQDWTGCFWPTPSIGYSRLSRRARLLISKKDS